ncbi:MAG: tRNA (cytidine(56)-2'-O)-methyltransferase [Candidatus ainarchaeum sp.]|nr:tRNA (cytidine(56)-2'-O)-methyltransferase [Candidatus ainarchaeum sp.]
MTKEIIVFRYGHREIRDYRVTSHCSLVSRALGAKKIIICGEPDKNMKKSVDDVTQRWGGPFKVEFVKDWKEELLKLKKKGYILVHLTMYGEEILQKEEEISKNKKICIIIGSQKVEKEVYHISNYNISVTKQPHSEIAALAITLDRIQKGNEFNIQFKNAKKQIIPSKIGKQVIDLK